MYRAGPVRYSALEEPESCTNAPYVLVYKKIDEGL